MGSLRGSKSGFLWGNNWHKAALHFISFSAGLNLGLVNQWLRSNIQQLVLTTVFTCSVSVRVTNAELLHITISYQWRVQEIGDIPPWQTPEDVSLSHLSSHTCEV